MNKRHFVQYAFAGLATLVGGSVWSGPVGADDADGSDHRNRSARPGSTEVNGPNRSVLLGGVTFAWNHRDARLNATLTAPTSGWIAAGFNSRHQLQGTRFVIASVSETSIRAEEHVAQVPHHQRIEDLGLVSGLVVHDSHVEKGRSTITFSLPERVEGDEALLLAPGAQVYLMLAWSHAPDFDHHSAWRRHLPITL